MDTKDELINIKTNKMNQEMMTNIMIHMFSYSHRTSMEDTEILHFIDNVHEHTHD